MIGGSLSSNCTVYRVSEIPRISSLGMACKEAINESNGFSIIPQGRWAPLDASFIGHKDNIFNVISYKG